MAYDEDTNRWARAGAVTSLTNANGTADNTIADVGASFDQATLNNNFRDLSDKVNAILLALRKASVIETD